MMYTWMERAIEWIRRLGYLLVNGDGRELAWVIYAQSIMGPDLPSYQQLRWNTRSFDVETVDAFETRKGGLAMVSGDLLKFEVRRWFRPPVVFHTVHVCVRLTMRLDVSDFERSKAYASAAAAKADFTRHRRELPSMIATISTSPLEPA
jgi:hypothetical protein